MEKELRACEQTCCPTCGRLWEDAADRAAQIMRLTASAAEAKRDLEKERQLKTRIARGSAMMAEQRELHAVRKQLAELAAETTPGKVDATKLDQKIHDLRERLRLHEEKAADATASADWIRRKAEASDEARQLALDVKAIELLVELFGKNGIKSDVTRAAADPVGEQLTATLSQWDMAARLNTDLVLEVQRHGKWRPAHACSDGERMLVALALQVWLAQNSGTRLVMIDRLEALDVDNLEMLVSACTSLLENGGVDHVILSGVEIDAFANVILHDQESLMEV